MTKEEIKSLINSSPVKRWKAIFNKVQKLNHDVKNDKIIGQIVQKWKTEELKLWISIFNYYLESTNSINIELASYKQWSEELYTICQTMTKKNVQDLIYCQNDKKNNEFEKKMSIFLNFVETLKPEIKVGREIQKIKLIELNFKKSKLNKLNAEKDQLLKYNVKVSFKIDKLSKKQETKWFYFINKLVTFFSCGAVNYQQKHINKINYLQQLIKNSNLILKNIESQIKNIEFGIKINKSEIKNIELKIKYQENLILFNNKIQKNDKVESKDLTPTTRDDIDLKLINNSELKDLLPSLKRSKSFIN